jgi:pyrroloquinoline quinone (PQQ) biosynthesis protein C
MSEEDNKKRMVSIQEFRPKKEQLKRILKQADKKRLEEIKKHAEENIKMASNFIKDKEKQRKMTEDAKKTIDDIEKEKIRRGKG